MPSAETSLLVIGAGPFQLPLLRAARAFDGLTTIAIDGSAAAPGLALCDRPIVLDFADHVAVVELARELHIGGVAAGSSNAALPALAAVVDGLGLPGPGRAVLEACGDKWRSARLLAAQGARAPRTQAVADPAEAAHAVAAHLGQRAVVKPSGGAGGRGVTILPPAPSAGEIAAAFADARSTHPAGPVLVQEFIAGQPFGADCFFRDGALAAAFLMEDQFQPGFVSPVGHSMPAGFGPREVDDIHAAIRSFGAALGFMDGPCNLDLVRTDRDIFLVEINPRLGGSGISDLVAVAHGADLPSATIALALGRDPTPHLTARPGRATACRLLLAFGDQTRPDHACVAEQRARAGVLDVVLHEERHGRAPVVNGVQIVGSCQVVAADPPAAAALARDVALTIARTIPGNRIPATDDSR